AYGERAGQFNANNVTGWIEVLNLANVEFAGEIPNGGMLAFHGDVPRFTINGAERSVNRLSDLGGWGNFSGRRSQDGQLFFEGTALGFWEDAVRLNPTRWEQLSVEVHIFVGGLFLSALGGASLLIVGVARANKI